MTTDDSGRQIPPVIIAHIPEADYLGNWAEDFGHENGKYLCRCCECHRTFLGHKRRVVCRLCYFRDTKTGCFL